MSAEATVALVAAIISLAALGISLWQISVQRKHNKLSVLPHLHADRFSLEGNPYRWQIVNAGAGPAIIKSFTVTIGKDKLKFPTVTLLASTMKSRGMLDFISLWNCKSGDYILVNQSIILLDLPPLKVSGYFEKTKDIVWIFEYESIYGDSKTLEFSSELDS